MMINGKDYKIISASVNENLIDFRLMPMSLYNTLKMVLPKKRKKGGEVRA
jgi:hypothetical protein